MGKIIISKVWDKLLLFLMDEQNHPELIRFLGDGSKTEQEIVGNIYIGRVSEVVPGMDGAFVSISSSQKVFLPLRECKNLILINRNLDPEKAISLKQGDELVVQITSAAVKTKLPGAAGSLSFTGNYCVCQMNGHGIHFSKKLSPEQIQELKQAISNTDIPGRKGCSFTIRTNAGLLPDLEPLFMEMKQFAELISEIRQTCMHRTVYSCLYQNETETVKALKGIPLDRYDEIVTDCPAAYRELEHFPSPAGLRFYQDELLALAKLYSLETHLKQALSKTVWLSCGGYLVIEPTEAMTVIDVNSGKGTNVKGSKRNHLYFNVNLEAAKEIARQLKLRNLSGMIMVDFINMDSKEEEKKLLQSLGKWLENDPIKTRLVDITALGIVEITRKKERKPLKEYFKIYDGKEGTTHGAV